MDKVAKPEEPLFYIGLLLVLIYFVYLFYKDRKSKVKQVQKINSLNEKIANAQEQFDNNSFLLKKELEKHYSTLWIENAFDGYIFKDMPIVLLKVALGRPSDITFNGKDGQIWKYNNANTSKLVVNIWEDQVTTWEKIN